MNEENTLDLALAQILRDLKTLRTQQEETLKILKEINNELGI